MEITKCLPTSFLLLTALPALPFFLALSVTNAKELPARGARHGWSALYSQPHQPSGKNDWYTPTRSPGWHEEAGN
jgi:hypothetical protein